MHTKSLIKRLLRIEKIAIEDVDFEIASDEDVLVINARPMSRDTNRCPKCGKRCKGYDSSNRQPDCVGSFEVWRFRYYTPRA